TRVRVEGLDVLEDLQPPVIFVSNHSSHLDAPLMLCSLPPAWRERTAVGAAADYFFDVWWRAAATALVFNAFPVERAGGARATQTAVELLRDGWNLVVFPEGTRSKAGWVQRFRTGAARLAIEQGVPVVPVAIRGSYSSMPRGRGSPPPGRFTISTRTGGEARRKTLVEEATRQFGSKGYDGTSLESVASAVGVRKQTLLYYFPTKDTLFEACVIEVSARVAAALTEALAAEQEPSRKAETVIHTLFALAEEWPVLPQFAREAGRMGPQ